MFILDQHRYVLGKWQVLVHRDGAHSGRSLREYLPLPFLIGEVDIVHLVIHLEVHFIPLVPYPNALSPNCDVILSGVDVREAGRNGVEGSLPFHSIIGSSDPSTTADG